MDATQLGTAGLQGWRGKVGDAVAGPVSRHSPLDDEQVRVAVGLLFLALSVLYIAKALQQVAARR